MFGIDAIGWDTLGTIFNIAKGIYDQVQKVKANKQQCQRLAERVRVVEQAVRGLEKLPNRAQYEPGLKTLQDTLGETLVFIQKFTEPKRWCRYLLKAGNHQGTFMALNDELQKALLQLNLGLAAQQITDQAQDRADQAADNDFIKHNQADILNQNAQLLRALQSAQLKQQEREAVLQIQLQAIHSQLKRVTDKPGVKYPHIPYYELTFEKLLTQGSFGKIYLGKWEDRTVVIKTLEGLITENEEHQFTREVQIMSRLKHPNITECYGACLEQGHACLVMEYMEKGSLEQYLEGKTLSHSQQQQIALDILKGLAYLHEQKVLHRDMKSGNILINAQGQAKITDFGLSKIEAASIQTAREKSNALPWQAPECFQYKAPYTEASDIYSIGVILQELAGQKPVFEFARLKDYSSMGLRQTPVGPLADIITQCCALEPLERPSAKALLDTLQVDSEALYQQGLVFEKQKQFLPAFQSYQQAMQRGHTKAQTSVGNFYLQAPNQIVAQDKAKAFEHFKASAEKGHVRAMVNTAMMLEYGDGIPKDAYQALTWYRKILIEEPNHKVALPKKEKLEKLLADAPSYQLYSTRSS